MVDLNENKCDSNEYSDFLRDFSYIEQKFENLKKIDCINESIKKQTDELEKQLQKMKKHRSYFECKKTEIKENVEEFNKFTQEKSELENEIIKIENEVFELTKNFKIENCNKNEEIEEEIQKSVTNGA